MEHIEQAGIHSGDSACVLPPHNLSKELVREIERQTVALAEELGVIGLMNIQFAVKDGDVYILEVNPRASRTAPFVSKATGVPLAKLATNVIMVEGLWAPIGHDGDTAIILTARPNEGLAQAVRQALGLTDIRLLAADEAVVRHILENTLDICPGFPPEASRTDLAKVRTYLAARRSFLSGFRTTLARGRTGLAMELCRDRSLSQPAGSAGVDAWSQILRIADGGRLDLCAATSAAVVGSYRDWPAGFLAERVGFEPTCRLLTRNPISSRARYDHFGTSPRRHSSDKEF